MKVIIILGFCVVASFGTLEIAIGTGTTSTGSALLGATSKLKVGGGGLLLASSRRRRGKRSVRFQ